MPELAQIFVDEFALAHFVKFCGERLTFGDAISKWKSPKFSAFFWSKFGLKQ